MVNSSKKPPIKNKKAFTLVELVISMTVFTVIVTVGSMVYMNTIRTQRKVNLEAAMFNEARAVIDKLSREIRYSAIDYDEYYNQRVIAKSTNAKILPNHPKYYGANFGEYSKNFYNPGLYYTAGTPLIPNLAINKGPNDRAGLGAQCSDVNDPPPCTGVAKLLKRTLDLNIGMNYWNAPDKANAFCDVSYNIPCDKDKITYYENDELYLINSTGTQKTIIAAESDGIDTRVAMLRLEGRDTNTDNIADQWLCAKNFACPGAEFTNPMPPIAPDPGILYKTDLTNVIDVEYFVPITPNTITIKNLKFIISPLEDPRRAFAEYDDATQIQPQVTIVLTITPSSTVLENYPDIPPELEVRTTVSSRINQVVKSYSPL